MRLNHQSWNTFQHNVQYISATISFILNSLLIFLIVNYSPKKLGTYKYLMVYISTFQIFYSLMDVISFPIFHTHGTSFIVFKEIKYQRYLNDNIHKALLVIYCSCYGSSMAIFAIHFIYRFLAVSGKSNIKYFIGPYLIFWFLVPVFYAIAWAFLMIYIFTPTKELDNLIETSILDLYSINLENICYYGSYFFETDPITDVITWNPLSLIGSSLMEFIMVSSFFTIFYFGIRCYLKIREMQQVSGMSSKLTKSLQRQLFHALVLQTFFPFILLYIPVTVLFSFPFFDAELGMSSGLISITIALYPVIDPLPTMLVITCYRNSIRFMIFSIVKKMKNVRRDSSVTSY